LKNLIIIYENRLSKVSVRHASNIFNGGVPDLTLKEFVEENHLGWKQTRKL
jgi:hypothetical protein